MVWPLYLVFFFFIGALAAEYNLTHRNFRYFTFGLLILGVILPFEGRILLIFPSALSMVLGSIAIIPKRIFDHYRWDLSFGVHIWTWPISQVTVVFSHGNLQHPIYLLVITLVTLVFSAISWKTIEQPALRRR